MDCSTPGFPVHHQLPEHGHTDVHPTISSSVVPFSSSLQSFPPSGSFPVSQLFTSDGQSTRVSASVSVLPVNIQDWFSFRIGWFDLLTVQGLSRVFSNTTNQKHQFLSTQPSLWSSSHIRTWLPKKLQLWLYGHLLAEWWCLFFLICCLGLSWLFFQGASIF